MFNPVTLEWIPSSFSVEDGKIVSISTPGGITGDKVTDLKGARVVPGLINSHLHIESTMLVPSKFGKLAVKRGVTTLIADPHEIANVTGVAGIDFMIEDSKHSPADIFFMIPSCVPATPADVGGAVLDADDIRRYKDNPKVLGLGEMMNYPGVIANDPDVSEKLSIFKHVDGHAPMLSGEVLNRYVAHGIKTDHECTSYEEALEKLRLGMYIFLREGEAAKNVAELSRLLNTPAESRCCFATDDKGTELIEEEGSVDNCIRVAVRNGVKLETAIRCATLNAAECFGLNDRGIVAPGRVADFCTLKDTPEFEIDKVYKNGVPTDELLTESEDGFELGFVSPKIVCKELTKEDLALASGKLRVIGLVKDEIITESLVGTEFDEGVCKVVCIDRYRTGNAAVGLAKGFGFKKGAIASTVAHDAHNLIAAGASDEEIIEAVNAVKECGGGMSVVCDGEISVIPLPVGGLMSDLSYPELCEKMKELREVLVKTGAVEGAFMHLSFLSLTVIPSLKITPRGLFDVDAFCDTDLQIR